MTKSKLLPIPVPGGRDGAWGVQNELVTRQQQEALKASLHEKLQSPNSTNISCPFCCCLQQGECWVCWSFTEALLRRGADCDPLPPPAWEQEQPLWERHITNPSVPSQDIIPLTLHPFNTYSSFSWWRHTNPSVSCVTAAAPKPSKKLGSSVSLFEKSKTSDFHL